MDPVVLVLSTVAVVLVLLFAGWWVRGQVSSAEQRLLGLRIDELGKALEAARADLVEALDETNRRSAAADAAVNAERALGDALSGGGDRLGRVLLHHPDAGVEDAAAGREDPGSKPEADQEVGSGG